MRRLRAAIVALACLAAAPAAWAASTSAKPVKGVQYEGVMAREGPAVLESPKSGRTKGRVLLRVARTGKTVKVLVPVLPTNCADARQGGLEKSSPVRISSKGAFKGTILYKEVFDPAVTAKASFSGHFSGRRATGTVRAEFLKVAGCNSSTTFTATAPKPPTKHR